MRFFFPFSKPCPALFPFLSENTGVNDDTGMGQRALSVACLRRKMSPNVASSYIWPLVVDLDFRSSKPVFEVVVQHCIYLYHYCSVLRWETCRVPNPSMSSLPRTLMGMRCLLRNTGKEELCSLHFNSTSPHAGFCTKAV